MYEYSSQGAAGSPIDGLNHFFSQGGILAELNGISEQSMAVTYSMAYSQYQFGHYENAAKAFQYLCFYDHWNPKNFLCLAACQQMLGLLDQAIETYLHSAKLDGINPLPLIYMGDCYMAQKYNKKAGLAFKEALNRAKKSNLSNEEINRAQRLLRVINEKE